jgi:EAL domain-containing protein (putative c-di-GMP-specific phosphodiesterase class I)
MTQSVETEPAESSAPEERLQRIVEFAHQYLSLDVAYVAELRDGMQLYRAVAGDAASFNIPSPDGLPAVATYDQRMAEGSIPNFIRDTSADAEVADLFVTRYARIGAYAGVPIRLSDGTLYGTLSCASHEPDHELGECTVRLLSHLADLVLHEVDGLRLRQHLRDQVVELIETVDFDVAYQPVFDLLDGRCVGLEALARFSDQFAGPAETFAAAHRIGLGADLEHAVMRRACDIASSLAPGQFLALNASPEAFLGLARRAGGSEDLPWPRIVVEVTEHSAVEAYAALQEALWPLRRRGLRIAVDDVGAGYASLRHVLELRPDFIKLDRWLIDGVAADGGRHAAVSAFVALAGELGSKVIGEGVERPEDLEALRQLGLSAAQGYLLGRPSTDRDVVRGWCDGTGTSAQWVHVGTTPSAAERPVPATETSSSDATLQSVGDSVTFLQDAVDELLRLTWHYHETLYGEAPIPVEERRRIMREAEERAEVEYLCEWIPIAFARTTDGIASVRSILARVDLELDELPSVTCNVSELGQVFLNVIINAAQALEDQVAPGGPFGLIRIAARVEGSEVLIEIADDGPGITPDEMGQAA